MALASRTFAPGSPGGIGVMLTLMTDTTRVPSSKPAGAASGEQARQVAEAAREKEWAKPSFAKELFLGRLRLDLVHPHPRPSPDQVAKGEEFLAKLEAFLREVDPLEIEHDAKVPDHVLKELCDIGALGMKIDEKYGGLGLSHLYYVRALGLVGTVNGAISTLLSAHQSIGAPQPLKLFGTEEQKQKFLPRLARDEISAFLLTEPDVGSDPARMTTSATPVDDGAAYLLNGTKLWATNGNVASLLVVMAVVPRSDGKRGGITAFVVEAHSPGITVLTRNGFMGLRGIENALMRFENVRVPAENMIGDIGRGLKIALTTLNTGRLSLPALCASSSKLSLKYAREWSNERVQWGAPVGKHEAVALKLADIAARTYAMEAVVELSSLLADEERNDIRLEAALAKLFCSEVAWQVADEMVQIRGGRGYETAESLRARGERPVPAEQILRDLRIVRIFEGSSEIMKLLIAREAVDQHLSVAGALVDPKATPADKAQTAKAAAAFYAKWLPNLVYGPGLKPGSYEELGEPLASELRFVERSCRKLARCTFYGMSRWQAGLEKKQGFLGRLVDIGAELFAMTASCVRAKMLLDDAMAEGKEPSGQAGAGQGAVELAVLFCRGSRRRVDRLFSELWRNDDDDNYRAAQRVLSGDYTWMEAGILDPSLMGVLEPATLPEGET
ncbi:MAG TPA: acyl-CoA dehydrogenase family protein [Acidimicrobiales bacterium]|nr:acyl-CoA dehydrogenase family protein [Acidimicrobiales bacterium]